MIIRETHGLTEVNSVFEIPIYRLSNANFQKELDDSVTKAIPYTREYMIEIQKEKGAAIYDGVWNNIKCLQDYKWKFNEIIGWITLHLNQNIIFGEIFLKDSKRIRKNSSSKITFHDCGFKVFFNKKLTNEEIFNKILDSINEVQNSKQFKKRFIDKNIFETIGPFIDWKNMYSYLND